jgi:hypothetical protein
MRRIAKVSLLCLAAGIGASACSTPDLVNPTEDLPYAGVRFINAVPDSAGAFGMDLRFVDLFENNAHFRITFRNTPGNTGSPSQPVSTAIQYKGTREGTRNFRIFLDDTVQSIASTVLKDTSVALVREHNYTAMMWGNGRSASTSFAGSGGDKMALSFWEEDVAAPAATKIKLRVVNATGAALDVYAFTGATVPAAPTWPALAAYSRSGYVEVDSGAYSYVVRNAGSATNLIGTTAVLRGQVATCSGRPSTDYTATNPSGCPVGQLADIEAAPGTRVAGTALSGIIFPPSVAGSRAAQFGSTGISFVWDKRPPRTCDPYC